MKVLRSLILRPLRRDLARTLLTVPSVAPGVAVVGSGAGMKLLRSLILRPLRRNLPRTLLTVLSVAPGVAVVVAGRV